MTENLRTRLVGKELKLFVLFSLLVFLAAAFATATPKEIFQGMKTIIRSRDALITDYFELAGFGASFFNAALVLGISFLLLLLEKTPFTGITMAAIFINVGYALWGKNPLNIWPMILGTALYARLHHARLGRYIYTALFGTSLAPLVTEMGFLLPFSVTVNWLISVAIGILIGFILAPLSMHTASMHMGYNLFNVGFSAGILAFGLVCILRSFGMESESVLIWKEGRETSLIVGMLLYFLLTFLYGLFLNHGRWKELWRITRHPGRAVADFVLMDGVGPTLMNMALVGMLCMLYILSIGGDLSGPVAGAILTAFGFAAFGVHVKNYLPVLAGVVLATLFNQFTIRTPGIQLAAVFAVGLAPVAGQFGILAGVIAGAIHSAIVMCTAQIYGGMNLYNNGFSAGWTAILLIPVLESFMKRFPTKKRRKDNHDS